MSICRNYRATWATLLLTVAVAIWPSAGKAVEIFGQVTVFVEGFKGFNTTLRSDLDIVVENLVYISKPDGAFHISTAALTVRDQDTIHWSKGDRNRVRFQLGTNEVNIPVDWTGWHLANDRVILTPVACYLDATGGVLCRNQTMTRQQLAAKWALRFGISDLRVPTQAREIDTKPVPVPTIRPEPTRPQLVRPLPVKPKPRTDNRPAAPKPAPDIVGPDDNAPPIYGPDDE